MVWNNFTPSATALSTKSSGKALQDSFLWRLHMDEIVIKSKREIKNLIFIFHGYGADKNDLKSIGEEFAKVCSDAEIHIPNGLDVCAAGCGRQWFALNGLDFDGWGRELDKNTASILQYIKSVMQEKNLQFNDVILCGFSQGAMISLNLGLQNDVKGVIAFSGMLLNPESYINKHIKTKVLLTHGKLDNVIPIDAMSLTESALKNLKIEVKAVISETLYHGIDSYVLHEAVDFLKNL